MKTIIIYGTWDCFHYGHYSILKRAKELGDYLIVGVSTDELCLKKGKQTILDENKRFEIVSSLKFVDKVIFENDFNQKIDDVKNYGVNIFVSGDDYKDVFPKMAAYKPLVDMGCEIIYLPRTPGISSSDLKEKLNKQMLLDADKSSSRNITKNISEDKKL